MRAIRELQVEADSLFQSSRRILDELKWSNWRNRIVELNYLTANTLFPAGCHYRLRKAVRISQLLRQIIRFAIKHGTQKRSRHSRFLGLVDCDLHAGSAICVSDRHDSGNVTGTRRKHMTVLVYGKKLGELERGPK
jgi:hypothetical protein